MKIMRWILIILLVAVFGLVGYGFYIKPDDLQSGEFFIGLGTVGFFFVVMPLFLYHRRQKIKIEDYMLTKETLKRMREHEGDKRK